MALLLMMLLLMIEMNFSFAGTETKPLTNSSFNRDLWKVDCLVDFCKQMNITTLGFLLFQINDIHSNFILRHFYARGMTSYVISVHPLSLSSTRRHLRQLVAKRISYFGIVEDVEDDILRIWKQIKDYLCGAAHWILFANKNGKELFRNDTSSDRCRVSAYVVMLKQKMTTEGDRYNMYSKCSPRRPKSLTSASLTSAQLRKHARFEDAMDCYFTPNLNGITLKLAVNELEPFVLLRKTENAEPEIDKGLDASLLLTLQEKFRFSVKVTIPTDGEWGRFNKGNWTGLIGMVNREEVDLAACCISQSVSRNQAADFTITYHREEFVLVTRNPVSKSKAYAVIRPFSLENLKGSIASVDASPLLANKPISQDESYIWILLLVSVFSGMFVLHVLGHLKAFLMSTKQPSFGEGIWFLYGTLLGQAGTMDLFQSKADVLFLGVWLWFVLVVRVSYIGPLNSFMSFPGYETSIETFQDLAKVMESQNYGCGAIKGSSTYDRLLKLSGPLKIISKRLEKDRTNELESVEDGLRRVLEGNFAAVLPKSSTQYKVKEFGSEDIRINDQAIAVGLIGTAMRKHFPYKGDFNALIRRMTEMGLVEKWKDDVIVKRSVGGTELAAEEEGEATSDEAAKSLTIWDLKGAMLVFCYGQVLGIVTLIAELVWGKMASNIRRMGKKPLPFKILPSS